LGIMIIHRLCVKESEAISPIVGGILPISGFIPSHNLNH
jgi:hypothetical protein